MQSRAYNPPLCWGTQRCKNSIHLHERLFEDPKIYAKNAWFATNSALSKVHDLQHFNTKKVEKQCETPGNSEKYQETVWNRVKQSQTETLMVSSCRHKHLTFIYTTLHKILHQYLPQLGNLYTSIARTARTFLHLCHRVENLFYNRNYWDAIFLGSFCSDKFVQMHKFVGENEEERDKT